MVTYSEWIEPPLQTLTLVAGMVEDGPDADVEQSPDAMTDAGLRLFWAREQVGESIYTEPASESPSPIYAGEAWTQMRQLPIAVGTNGIGDLAIGVPGVGACYNGWHVEVPSPNPPRYGQDDIVQLNWMKYRLYSASGSPRYEPPESEFPDGTVGLEYDTGGAPWGQMKAELVSIEIQDPNLPPHFTLRWIPPQSPPPDPGLTTSQENGPQWGSMTVADLAYLGDDISGGHTLTAAEVEFYQNRLRYPGEPDGGRLAADDGQMVLVYNGGFPGYEEGSNWRAASGLYQWIADVDVRVNITYQTSRYRYVISQPERVVQPPRRIFPRDDGLTGGARRVWPPSKSHQWGNRVDGSGYL